MLVPRFIRHLNRCAIGALLIALFPSIGQARDDNAHAWGLLQRQASETGHIDYRVPRRVAHQVYTPSAFETVSGAKRQWRFSLTDLQPGFETKRMACRNPALPLHCLPPDKARLPRCNAFVGMEADFIRVSFVKTPSGDAPSERGLATAWSRLSAQEKALVGAVGAVPAVVGGAALVGAAALVAAPALAINAVTQPECIGWHTQWVEFDHSAFKATLQTALKSAGMDKAADRRMLIQQDAPFQAHLTDEYARANQQLAKWMEQSEKLAAPWRSHLAALGVTAPWPYPTGPRWLTPDPDEWEADARMSFAQALTQLRARLATQLEQTQRQWADRWPDTLGQLKTRALEALQQRLAQARSMSDLLPLKAALDQWGDPGEFQQELSAAMASARQKESDLDLALAERLHQTRQRLQDTRQQAEQDLSAFRSGLSMGAQTHCGTVTDLRPPLAKIALRHPVGEKERWFEMDQLYPPGMACRFEGRDYVPPA